MQSLTDVVVNKSTGEVSAQYGTSSGGVTTVINPDGTTSSVASSQLEHYQAGIVTVGAGATISTAGLLVNDTLNSATRDLSSVVLNGGTIKVSGYQVDLRKGGLLNVSGGVLLTPVGSVSYGNAGAISLSGGEDLQGGSLKDIVNGSLQLGATLEGYAGTGGYGISGGTAGTLSIAAPAIQIGGSGSDARNLNLTPSFFNLGGFGSFKLTGIGLPISGSSDFTPGIDIVAGTVIHPEVAASIITYSDHGVTLTTFTPSAPYGTAPNLSLTATGLSDTHLEAQLQLLIRGDLVMGAGASITLDPQLKLSGSSVTASTGSISLTGQTVALLGAITVPGGTITVADDGGFQSNVQSPTAAQVTIDLAPTARLSTAGEAFFIQDPLGMRQRFGTVLSGGSGISSLSRDRCWMPRVPAGCTTYSLIKWGRQIAIWPGLLCRRRRDQAMKP